MDKSLEYQVINFLVEQKQKAVEQSLLQSQTGQHIDPAFYGLSTHELRDKCGIDNTGGIKNEFRDMLKSMADRGLIRYYIILKPASMLWYINPTK